MARILGGAMPTPYGSYDPGSGGPRMDLWFRKIMEDMQGIKEQKAAKTEAGRKAGMEERRLRIGERGVELREAEAEREQQPLVLPPEMVGGVSKHFDMTPEAFQGLNKDIQIKMIGEWQGEKSREKERGWREGQEANKLSRLQAEQAVKDKEKEDLSLLQSHYGILSSARARLNEERTRIVNMRKTDYKTGRESLATQTELDSLTKYFDMLGAMDGKLNLKQPLSDTEITTLKQILEDIKVVRSGELIGGGLKQERRGEFPKKWKEGDIRQAEKAFPELGIEPGDWVIYMGNNEWVPYKAEKFAPHIDWKKKTFLGF